VKKSYVVYPYLIELRKGAYIHDGYRFIKDVKFCHIVWNAYNPNDKIIKGSSFCIHHKDGNRLNDNIKNLEKLTHGGHVSLHKSGNKHHMFGKHHTEGSKKKMSIVQKGNKNWLGKRHTEETKRKIGEAFRGEKHPMFGKHHSEETKRKIGESRRGKYHTAETKKRMSEVKKGNKYMLGKKLTAEHKRKIGESSKRRWEIIKSSGLVRKVKINGHS